MRPSISWATRRTGRPPMRSPERPNVIQRQVRCAFWERIAEGLSSEGAALACGISQAVGTRWFREAGGVAPGGLDALSGRYLSFAERGEFPLLHAQGHGVPEIGRRLRRSASTVSRELRRNAATRGHQLVYRATVAQWKAARAARRPKPAKLAANTRLRAYVRARLSGTVVDADGRPILGPNVPWKGRRHGCRTDRRWGTCWGPEQVSRRLAVDFHQEDSAMRISHEASTRRCAYKGAVRYAVSWRLACAPGVRCVSHVHVRGGAARHSYPRGQAQQTPARGGGLTSWSSHSVGFSCRQPPRYGRFFQPWDSRAPRIGVDRTWANRDRISGWSPFPATGQPTAALVQRRQTPPARFHQPSGPR